jgi:hypothetical protein
VREDDDPVVGELGHADHRLATLLGVIPAP